MEARQVVVAAAVVWLAAWAGGAAAEEKDEEEWECSAGGVARAVVAGANLKLGKVGFGYVDVHGVVSMALFSVKGFERVWHIGKPLKYTFKIQADGVGLYYDWSQADEHGFATPSQVFRCVLVDK